MSNMDLGVMEIEYCNYYGNLLKLNGFQIRNCNCNKEHIELKVQVCLEYKVCPKCRSKISTWWKILTKPRIPWYIKVDLFNVIKNYYPIQQAREKETTIFYGAFGAGIYLYCPVCNSLL